MDTMEIIREVDEAHAVAVSAYYTALEASHAASMNEHTAMKERENAYKEALKGGFVIEQVLEPSRINYFGGYRRHNRGIPAWLPLDKEHTDQLRETFAGEVEINSQYGLDGTSPMHLNVGFKVQGVNSNQYVNPAIARDNRVQRDVTRYKGLIDAIEWRLPTEEEIQKYARFLATGEA